MTAYTRDSLTHILGSPITDAETAVTAAGAGDATEVDGNTIDLSLLSESPQEITAIVFGVTTLATTETLSITANWQEASNTGFSTDVGDVPDGDILAAVVAVTAVGAETDVPFMARISLNMQLVTQSFVRLQWTPDLSAGSLDVATIFGVYLIGGGQVLPTTAVGRGASA